MEGEDHHHMILIEVTAVETIMVDFQGILTTGVCFHESYIWSSFHFWVYSMKLKPLVDILFLQSWWLDFLFLLRGKTWRYYCLVASVFLWGEGNEWRKRDVIFLTFSLYYCKFSGCFVNNNYMVLVQDHMRRAGDVCFSEVYRDCDGKQII